MNCRASELLLLADQDGTRSETQRADLARHLAGCPACRQLQANLAAAATALAAEAAGVRVPDAGLEWERLRARLHEPAKPVRRRPAATILWFGAPLAAAAALALAFFVTQPGPASPPPGDLRELAHADYVEVDDARATPLVYVDDESGWLVVWAVDADGATKG